MLLSCYPECQEAKKQLQIYKIYCLVFEIKASFPHLFTHLCIYTAFKVKVEFPEIFTHNAFQAWHLFFYDVSKVLQALYKYSLLSVVPVYFYNFPQSLDIPSRLGKLHLGTFFTPPGSFSSPVTSRGNAGSSVSSSSHLNCYFGIVLGCF